MEPVAHLKNPVIPDELVALASRTEAALVRLPNVPDAIAEVAQLVEVEVPPVVTDFIVAFDAGDYAFLFDDEPRRVGHAVGSTATLGEFA
jgi:hypothetical protein